MLRSIRVILVSEATVLLNVSRHLYIFSNSGVVSTSIWHQPSSKMTGLAVNIVSRLCTSFGISAEEGAVTPVWLAVAPEPASENLRGMFWDRMAWKWVMPWVLEADRQEKLWDLWCKETGAPLR